MAGVKDEMGSKLGDDAGETLGDGAERLVPADAAAVDLGVQQAAVEVQRLAERGTLGAQAAVIGRVGRVAAHLPACPVGRRAGEDAAAHAAVRAGGAHRAGHLRHAPPRRSGSAAG